jgi:hypothetical protein
MDAAARLCAEFIVAYVEVVEQGLPRALQGHYQGREALL